MYKYIALKIKLHSKYKYCFFLLIFFISVSIVKTIVPIIATNNKIAAKKTNIALYLYKTTPIKNKLECDPIKTDQFSKNIFIYSKDTNTIP